MLERKYYYKLLEWKISHKNECLLIKGARQIGKTFIVRQFGKNEYEYFIEINFEETPELKNAFAGSLYVNDLIQKKAIKEKLRLWTHS